MTGKTIGEMTSAERAQAIERAASAFQSELERTAPAIGALLETAETTEQEETAPRAWSLSPDELTATRAKVAAINARAARKGFTGRYDVHAVRADYIERNALTGFEITHVRYAVTLTGEAPSYGGARFLARVDWNNDTPIIATAPGIDVAGGIDRAVLVPGACAHCNVSRDRRNTYIIETATGAQVQIGSTCIKDYLGWHTLPVFISEATGADELDEFIGGGFGGARCEEAYAPLDILATSWAVIRTFGFVPKSSYDGTPTAETVKYALGYYRMPTHRECARGACAACNIGADLARIAPLVSEASGHAETVRAFILSDAFAGASEYVTNLKSLAGAELAEGRFIGLLASAPQAYAKHLDQTLIREAREAKPSAHVGAAGDKLTVTVKIENIRYIDGQYGTTVLYVMRDESTGNVYKWFASREALGDALDVTVTIKGTVKKHETYNGLASTVLTRCKPA